MAVGTKRSLFTTLPKAYWGVKPFRLFYGAVLLSEHVEGAMTYCWRFSGPLPVGSGAVLGVKIPCS